MKRKCMFHKTIFAITLLLALSFGLILADIANRPRNFAADFQVGKLFKKNTAGNWELFDSATAFNINFTGNLSDLAATRKRVATNFIWSGSTKSGRTISTQLLHAELPYDGSGHGEGDFRARFTLDGKSVDESFKLTTRSVSLPDGTLLNGTPVELVNKIQTLTLVGAHTFRISLDNKPPEEILFGFKGRLVVKPAE